MNCSRAAGSAANAAREYSAHSVRQIDQCWSRSSGRPIREAVYSAASLANFRSVLNVVVEAGHADSEPIGHRLHCEVAQPKLTGRSGDEVSVDDLVGAQCVGSSASSDFSTGWPARLDFVADIGSIGTERPSFSSPQFHFGSDWKCDHRLSRLLLSFCRKLSDPADRGAILPGIGGRAVKVRCRLAVVAWWCRSVVGHAPARGAGRRRPAVRRRERPPSTINITYIYNDLSISAMQHGAPIDGNVLGDVQDAVDYLNADRGLRGREINPDVVQDAELDRFSGKRRCGMSGSDRRGPRLHRVCPDAGRLFDQWLNAQQQSTKP